MDPETRLAFIQGLHDMATFLEEHPGLPVPYTGVTVNIFPSHVDPENPKAAFGALAKTLGSFEKVSIGNWLCLRHAFGPHQIDVTDEYQLLCERRVVGTEVVEVPDPAAPKVTIEREVVEWQCPPSVLALATPAA